MRVSDYAERCAARIPVGEMRFDPTTIMLIFTQVIPLLMNCLQNRVSEPDPAEMRSYIRTENAKRPKKLRKRIAGRIRGKAEEPMSVEESLQLAEAVITEAEATEDDDTEIVALMLSCKAELLPDMVDE